MKSTLTIRIKKPLPLLLILLLSLLFFAPVLLQGKTFFAFDVLFDYLPWSSYASDFRVQNTLISDPVNNLYPYSHFIKNCLREKTLPLWNPFNFCGTPYASGYMPHGNPVVFLAILLLPLSVAHDFVLWFYLFGAGLFMFLYLKQIDLETCPALVGAVSWMFNGYVMVFFEIETPVILACSLSASLYFIELWFRKRKRLHCLLITAALAVCVSSGYAHLIIYQLLFVAVYFSYRCLTVKKDHPGFQKIGRRDLIHLGMAVILGILLSANFLTSFLSFLDDPQRSSMSFRELFRQTGQLPAKYLTTLLFPDFFGSPASLPRLSFIPKIPGGDQAYNNYSELCVYSGVLTLFLAAGCLPGFRRRRHVPFHLITALAALTVAMGSTLYYPLVRLVPGLGFSAPTRILYIFGFSMSVLAALGAGALLNAGRKEKRAFLVCWSLLLAIAVVITLAVQTETGVRWAAGTILRPDTPQIYGLIKNHYALSSLVLMKPLFMVVLCFLALGGALLSGHEKSKRRFLFLGTLVLAFDLISFGLVYNTAAPRTFEYPETEAIRFLKNKEGIHRIITYGWFLHNSFAPFGIEDVGGYHSFYPKRYGEFLHLCQYGPDAPLPDKFNRWTEFRHFGSPHFDLINTKYVLTDPSFKVALPKLERVYDGEIKIYENKAAFPRAFFVPAYQYCGTRKEAYETTGAYGASDFREKVILETPPPSDFKDAVNPPVQAADASVKIVQYGFNRMEIAVSSPLKGFLVLSDAYHPAWRAVVDGKQVEVLRANYVMRAVPLVAGDHRVVLTFQPALLRAGILLTVMGWIFLVVFMGAAFLQEVRGGRRT